MGEYADMCTEEGMAEEAYFEVADFDEENVDPADLMTARATETESKYLVFNVTNIVKETEKAILFELARGFKRWIPKSMCIYNAEIKEVQVITWFVRMVETKEFETMGKNQCGYCGEIHSTNTCELKKESK